MNIETSELIQLIAASTAKTNGHAAGLLGQRIVVLDRGFIYVGTVTENQDRIVITDAKNIRYWGTTNGLGELANGPTSKTKLDVVGTVEVYKHAVIHMIPCKGF